MVFVLCAAPASACRPKLDRVSLLRLISRTCRSYRAGKRTQPFAATPGSSRARGSGHHAAISPEWPGEHEKAARRTRTSASNFHSIPMDGIADSLGLPDFSTHVQQMICHPQNARICGGFDRDIEGCLEDRVIVLEQFGQYRLQSTRIPSDETRLCISKPWVAKNGPISSGRAP